MVIRECLNVMGGNSGLTEEIIYWNPPKDTKSMVTVYSGATLGTTLLGTIDKGTLIKGKPIKIFMAPAIVIVRKGLAGKTKFIEKGKFTINDDAYVITVKEKYLDDIHIEWVEKVIQNYANNCITSKGTNGTFSKEQFLNLEFIYPPMHQQEEIIRICKDIDTLKKQMYYIDGCMKKLDAYIIYSDSAYQKEAGKIFVIKGGNSGLTEEFIYNNQPVDEKDAIVVFSSSTDEATNMGVVSKNAKINGQKIKSFIGPSVIISRNGQAGRAMFIEKGTFTINDHAYVLTVKEMYRDQIDLEWFSYVCEKYTKKCVSSKESNGTFSKEIFLKEIIDVIEYDSQKKIVQKKKNLCKLHSKLKKFITMLDGKEMNSHLEMMTSRS